MAKTARLVPKLKKAEPRIAAQIKAAAGIAPGAVPIPAAGIAPEAAPIPAAVIAPGAVPIPAAAVPQEVPAVPALAPGKERWPVKTGTDGDVKQVNLSAGIVSTTIDELVSAARPGGPNGMPDPNLNYPAFQAHRTAPVETTVWRLDCEITAAKLEADGDYHLVLRSPSAATMIGEVPDPDPQFVSPTSPFLADIKSVRSAVEARIFKKLLNVPLAAMGKYMVPASTFQVAPPTTTTISAARKGTKTPSKLAPFPVKAAIKPIKVRLTGVGFFDRKHDQIGVAPNGIELHPVLDIKFL